MSIVMADCTALGLIVMVCVFGLRSPWAKPSRLPRHWPTRCIAQQRIAILDHAGINCTKASFPGFSGQFHDCGWVASIFNIHKSECGTTFVNDYIEAMKHDKQKVESETELLSK
jgi:hypothetical protein